MNAVKGLEVAAKCSILRTKVGALLPGRRKTDV